MSTRPEPRYSPHPALGMEAAARAKLATDTGKTFSQWVALARRRRIGKLAELRESLRADGLAPRVSWWIAQAALSAGEPDYDEPAALVDALYSGPRAALRALHERLVDAFLALGDDVLVTACKTMVPVYRKFVFGELRPSVRGVQVTLALGDDVRDRRLRKPTGRADDDRLTHAVVVTHEDAIDEVLRGWLARAYANGGKRASRPTEVEVPPEFAAALRRSKAAAATWETCTPAMRRDMLAWITSAKQQSTRDKRLGTALDKLASGQRRVY